MKTENWFQLRIVGVTKILPLAFRGRISRIQRGILKSGTSMRHLRKQLRRYFFTRRKPPPPPIDGISVRRRAPDLFEQDGFCFVYNITTNAAVHRKVLPVPRDADSWSSTGFVALVPSDSQLADRRFGERIDAPCRDPLDPPIHELVRGQNGAPPRSEERLDYQGEREPIGPAATVTRNNPPFGHDVPFSRIERQGNRSDPNSVCDPKCNRAYRFDPRVKRRVDLNQIEQLA